MFAYPGAPAFLAVVPAALVLAQITSTTPYTVGLDDVMLADCRAFALFACVLVLLVNADTASMTLAAPAFDFVVLA